MEAGRTKGHLAAWATIAGAVLVGGGPGAAGEALQSPPAGAAPPPHLTMLSAVISERPSADRGDVAGRRVRLRIRVAGRPDCSGNASLEYGFAIDADNDPHTGLSDPVFADLGVDARIGATCDPTSGLLTSRMGEVAATTASDDGSTEISVTTTAGRLPSTRFRWIAYARGGDHLSRVPDAPQYGAWAILERRLH